MDLPDPVGNTAKAPLEEVAFDGDDPFAAGFDSNKSMTARCPGRKAEWPKRVFKKASASCMVGLIRVVGDFMAKVAALGLRP